MAWIGRPMAAGSMSAWKPRITPRSRSARTRPRQVEAATPASSASALLGIRASAASACSSTRSTASSTGRLHPAAIAACSAQPTALSVSSNSRPGHMPEH